MAGPVLSVWLFGACFNSREIHPDYPPESGRARVQCLMAGRR